MPLDDFFVVQGESRIVNITCDHCLGLLEEMFVVTVGTTECSDRCHSIPTSTRSTGALLIIRTRRRKIS